MFLESALVHSGLINGMRVVYDTPLIFKFPPELWRLLSSFLLTNGGFSFVFDLYFSKSKCLSFDHGVLLILCSSVHILFRLGVEFTSVHPAWRLFHLCVFRRNCSPGTPLSSSSELFPKCNQLPVDFPLHILQTPRISARPVYDS